MATIEELKTRASMVIDALHVVLDDLIPLMRLYPLLPREVRTDAETAIDTIQRFYHALETWRVPEPTQDEQTLRMRNTLELLARMGRSADQRLREGSDFGDIEQHDVAVFAAFRQVGEIADRGLGNDWIDKEGDDGDLRA